MNTDQPVKNSIWWKSSDLDDKWRWMWFDLDDTFGLNKHNNYDRNGLIFSTSIDNVDSTKLNKQTKKPNWAPNRPRNTKLLRSFIKNDNFQEKFINRFADLLNTVFLPEHSIPLLDSLIDLTQPYQIENYLRWHYPKPEVRLDEIRKIKTFLSFRGDCMYNHIVDYFNISGYYNFTTHINEKRGYVRINSINIKSTTPGVTLEQNNGFWSGTYFKEVPITIEAIPEKGYVFSHWEGDFISNKRKLKLDLDKSINLNPVFIHEDHYTVKEKRLVSVFPSPNDKFMIISFSRKLPKEKNVVIKNQYGKKVLSINTTSRKNSIPIQKLPKGIYSAQIKTTEFISLERFIVY